METLKERLAKLVYDYSIKEKIADKEFVDQVVEMCVEEFNLRDYVKTLNLDSDGNNEMIAGYNIENKNLALDLHTLIGNVISRVEIESRSGIATSSFLMFVKVNIDVINSIVHELQHAMQYKKCLTDQEGFDRKILEMSMVKNLSLLRGKALTPAEEKYLRTIAILEGDEVFYESLPHERMANITGLEYDRDISKLLSTRKKGNLEAYTEARLLLGKMMGYKECSPTAFAIAANETIKRNIGLPHDIYRIDQVEQELREESARNNFSLDERLYYGLPISDVEKEQLDNKLARLKRSLFR